MTKQTQSPIAIRQKAYEVLLKELGPVELIRFIQSLEFGVGDYTKDRDKKLGESSLEEVFQEIKEART